MSASAATFGKRTLSIGMTGGDVVALQGDLTALGLSTSVSGDFNRETIHEVRVFQRRHRLQVDGVVGPATFRALRRALRREDGNHVTEQALAASGGGGMADSVRSKAAPSSAALPSADSGGVGFVPAPQNAPEVDGTLIDGLAVAAPGTPQTVVSVIAAANRIAFLPYIYGGGHSAYVLKDGVVELDAGYDCSGSVSFALHGGSLLADPLDSEQFYGYGQAGAGRWITLFTKGSYHVLMRVAGLWFDTAAQSPDNGNDRWSAVRISPLGGYEARHPAGW
ncbi:MAG: peptidoglycan-binding domain-containing protein [Solirubrobacteraceae bacterium]